MITFQGYSVAHPDALETPAMLLFQDRLEHNIRSACEMVGGQNLMAHVKTHKSEAITRKQIEAGIHGFKCATLNELAMVLKAGRPTRTRGSLRSSVPRFTSRCWPRWQGAAGSRCEPCSTCERLG